MNFPTRLIDSDDPIVADLLAATIGTILECGGYIHPAVTFVARSGDLSVRADVEPRSVLFDVPQECFVRVDDFVWADDDSRLVIAEMPPDVGDVECEVAYLQAALHNQCGKLGWIRRHHPACAPDLPEDALTSLRRFVPAFRAAPIGARDLLFANRCFRIPVQSGVPQRMLVPLVDLLNHHTHGARGSRTATSFSVDAAVALPGNECALDYGMDRDAMEMAAVYGFVDSSAQVAHCASSSLYVDGFGQVNVRGPLRTADGSHLPMSAEVTEDGLVITGLRFGREHDTAAELQRLLGINDAAARALALAVLTDQSAVIDSANADCTGDAAWAQVMRGALSVQGDIVRSSLAHFEEHPS